MASSSVERVENKNVQEKRANERAEEREEKRFSSMTYDERERRGYSGEKGEEKVDREEEKCGQSRVVSHANSSCKPRSPINDPLFCAGARQRNASLVIVVMVVIVASRRCFRRRRFLFG